MVRGVDVSYSLDALEADGVADWDGVRNYQARNIMRDDMAVGDLALYYHSNCKEPGVVGVVEVVRAGYPDECAWDPEDPHYDPKTDPAAPRWFKVDVKFLRRTARLVGLRELKAHPALADMALVRSGRLSVQPVRPAEWRTVMELEGQPAPPPAAKGKGGGKTRGTKRAAPAAGGKARKAARAK